MAERSDALTTRPAGGMAPYRGGYPDDAGFDRFNQHSDYSSSDGQSYDPRYHDGGRARGDRRVRFGHDKIHHISPRANQRRRGESSSRHGSNRRDRRDMEVDQHRDRDWDQDQDQDRDYDRKRKQKRKPVGPDFWENRKASKTALPVARVIIAGAMYLLTFLMNEDEDHDVEQWQKRRQRQSQNEMYSSQDGNRDPYLQQRGNMGPHGHGTGGESHQLEGFQQDQQHLHGGHGSHRNVNGRQESTYNDHTDDGRQSFIQNGIWEGNNASYAGGARRGLLRLADVLVAAQASRQGQHQMQRRPGPGGQYDH